MGLFDFDDDTKNLEEEMDNYGLDDEEKELVRNGEYDPWDFEEPQDGDEINEDDYYAEDDF